MIIAGQEYQRVLPCIHAVQAGKDVYAKKPLTLYIQEGRTLIQHVRKHQAVFQVGIAMASRRKRDCSKSGLKPGQALFARSAAWAAVFRPR